jgi:hypothetical protein
MLLTATVCFGLWSVSKNFDLVKTVLYNSLGDKYYLELRACLTHILSTDSLSVFLEFLVGKVALNLVVISIFGFTYSVSDIKVSDYSTELPVYVREKFVLPEQVFTYNKLFLELSKLKN